MGAFAVITGATREYALFYGKIRPRSFIVNHDVVGLFHADFFVKGYCVLVGASVHDYVFLAACQLMQLFNKGGSHSLSRALAYYAQIGHEKPVGKISYAEANADYPIAFVSCNKTYRSFFTSVLILSLNLSLGYWEPKSVSFRKSIYCSGVSLSSFTVKFIAVPP